MPYAANLGTYHPTLRRRYAEDMLNNPSLVRADSEIAELLADSHRPPRLE